MIFLAIRGMGKSLPGHDVRGDRVVEELRLHRKTLLKGAGGGREPEMSPDVKI